MGNQHPMALPNVRRTCPGGCKVNGLRIGSLFSGIGGLELGLEQAGVGHTVFQVECEPYAVGILGKRWPSVPCYHDVREVGAGNLPPCDVLVGGFPCQDLSRAAGAEAKGLDGKRSGLFFEFARLIGELRPRLVVMENVPTLLNRGFGRVLGTLAALGYDARWEVVSASQCGAWHERERLFIIAAPTGRLGAPIPDANSLGLLGGQTRLEEVPGMGERPGVDPWSSGPDVPDPDGMGLLGNQGRAGRHRANQERQPSEASQGRPDVEPGTGRPVHWGAEPPLGRVANGVPAGVDRLRCIGNAVSPEVARTIGLAVVCRGWAS